MTVEIRAADFPPPFSSAEVIAAPTDAVGERIEVGVLIVGGGPAGLACAIRLGQLLEEDPATADRLGEVPVALVDKGKQPGSHLLSGAVMNPRAVRRLFSGHPEQLDGVADLRDGAGRGCLPADPEAGVADPAAADAPQPRQLDRLDLADVPVPRRAGGGGRHVRAPGDLGRPAARRSRPRRRHPQRRQGPREGRRAARQLRARRGHRREGDGARRRHGRASDGCRARSLRAPRPRASDLGARREGGLAGRRSRCGKIVHTLGWPLRKSAKYREFGGSWLYPMGDDMVSLGFVVGLDYRDVELSAHDLLQEFKTHPFVRAILDGGERVAWGAKTITSGGWHAMPRSLGAPGAAARGRERGSRRPRPTEGRALRDRIGPPRGRGGVPLAPAR